MNSEHRASIIVIETDDHCSSRSPSRSKARSSTAPCRKTAGASTNELAAFHRINPATAAKGLNQLVGEGILYKKRGIGMFVTVGARDALRFRRREAFARQYIEPLFTEADRLQISLDELKSMLDDRKADR